MAGILQQCRADSANGSTRPAAAQSLLGDFVRVLTCRQTFFFYHKALKHKRAKPLHRPLPPNRRPH